MMDKWQITCYYPYASDANLYVHNTQRLISGNGYDIVSFREVLRSPKLFKSCRTFNFNWLENTQSFKDYIRKVLMLDFLKLFNKKIIFTLHNRQAHFIGNHKWNLRLTHKLCKVSDVIVGLCPETKEIIKQLAPGEEAKIYVIPHPNYFSNYERQQDVDLRAKYGLESDDLVLLHLSQLRPYKNLETLIDVVKGTRNPHLKLLLAGRPETPEYQKALEERIGSCNRIKTDFRFIPDGEVADFFRASNVVILPYQKRSSLNSGSVYLAFSMKKTVVCPDIGSINFLPNQSFVYSYSYEKEEEHAEKLRESLQRVCDDFDVDPQKAVRMGIQAYEYMCTVHSDEKVGGAYRDLYASL